MARPPKHAGIYTLVNRREAKIYVGQAVNLYVRYVEWITSFNMQACRSAKMTDVIRCTKIEDWIFKVVLPMDGATKKQLNNAEQKTIQAVHQRFPDTILNTQLPLLTGQPIPQRGNVALSEILDATGERVSTRTAAHQLGVSYDVVHRRLKRLRDQGITRVSVEEMRS